MYPHAVACALRGIEAVNPRALVRDDLQKRDRPEKVYVISIGKAAETMVMGALDTWSEKIVGGIVIAPTQDVCLPDTFKAFLGGHPIPNEEGEKGALAILDLANSLTEDDTVLCLISGGASALSMCPPEGVKLEDAQALTTLMLRSGATIDELNCVRKHLDRLKGGRLARAIAPARLITLILSDVIGDPVETIASGPTVADPGTFEDAINILKRRDLWDEIPDRVRIHMEAGRDESPKPGDACFTATITEVIGNNVKAAEAALKYAQSLGYLATIETTALAGEARDRGREIAQHALEVQADMSPMSRSECFIYAGEPTVTVSGDGKGGRNQELVLAAAIALNGQPGITVASVGTDGIDGPTPAAGAFADSKTLENARSKRLNPNLALLNNNSYPFWKGINGLVMTGPTGTNVMDLIIVTVEPLSLPGAA